MDTKRHVLDRVSCLAPPQLEKVTSAVADTGCGQEVIDEHQSFKKENTNNIAEVVLKPLKGETPETQRFCPRLICPPPMQLQLVSFFVVCTSLNLTFFEA